MERFVKSPPPPPPRADVDALGENGGCQTDLQGLSSSSPEKLVEEIISSGDLSRMDAAVSRLESQLAYELAVRIVRAKLEVLGPDDADAAGTTGRLADLLRKQQGEMGKTGAAAPQRLLIRLEAEKAFESAIERLTRTVGRDDASTLLNTRGLANLLAEEAEKAEKATRLYERALDGFDRAFGPDHAETLTTADCLAKLMRGRYNLEGARKLYERVVEGRTRALGPDHASTLLGTMNVAAVITTQAKSLRDREMFEEAVKLYERAVEGLTRALGPDHLDTLNATMYLADALMDQGCGGGGRGGFFCKGNPRKLWRAMELLERVVNGRQRVLGPEHPETVNAKRTLNGVRAGLCCCCCFCCCFTCFC